MVMSSYNDKLNSPIPLVILAGGLGSRLLGTESLPKPLVTVQGKPLITHIIDYFLRAKVFSRFIVLTCCDHDQIFASTLRPYASAAEIEIVNEPARSGRLGALKYLCIFKPDLKYFFVCNGDTLFTNPIRNDIIQSFEDWGSSSTIAYVATADTSRTDYKLVSLSNTEDQSAYQNSGLCYLSSDTVGNWVNQYGLNTDIDNCLFSSDSSNKTKVSVLHTELLDCGTPYRLMKARASSFLQ